MSARTDLNKSEFGERGNATHPVVDMFSSGNSNTMGFESFADIGMTNNIVWRSGFFDEPRFERFKLLHILDSLWYIPHLYQPGNQC